MASNTMGFVPITDGEVPRTISAVALETISGGQCVVLSGAFNAVGSQSASFATTDLTAALVVDSERVNGVATQNVTSGNLVSVCTRGSVILKTLGSVLQGTKVEAVSSEGVQSLSSGVIPNGLYTKISANKAMGRAFTAAGSNQHALIQINP